MSETSVKTEGNTTAVVIAKQPARDYTMGLFETDKFLNTPQIARAFGVKAILDKDGNEVGFRAGHNKRSDIAKANGLTMGKADKEKVDALIMESELTYFKMLKAYLVMQPDGSIGVSRFSSRRDKNGVATHTVAFREIPHRVMTDVQKLADSRGISVDALLAEWVANYAKPPTVEVEATVTQAALSAPVMKVVPPAVKK